MRNGIKTSAGIIAFSLILCLSGCKTEIFIDRAFEEKYINKKYYKHETIADSSWSNLLYDKFYYNAEEMDYYSENAEYLKISDENIDFVKNIILSFEEDIHDLSDVSEEYQEDYKTFVNRYDFNLTETVKIGDYFYLLLKPKVFANSTVFPENQRYKQITLLYISVKNSITYRFILNNGSCTLKSDNLIEKWANQNYGGYIYNEDMLKDFIKYGDEKIPSYYYVVENESQLKINQIYPYGSGVDFFYDKEENDTSEFIYAIGFKMTNFINKEDCFDYYSMIFSNYDKEYGVINGESYMKAKVHDLTYYFMFRDGDVIVVLENNTENGFDFSKCKIKKVVV